MHEIFIISIFPRLQLKCIYVWKRLENILLETDRCSNYRPPYPNFSTLDSVEAEEPKRGKQAWSVSNSRNLFTRPNGAWLPMARITKRKEGYGIGGAGRVVKVCLCDTRGWHFVAVDPPRSSASPSTWSRLSNPLHASRTWGRLGSSGRAVGRVGRCVGGFTTLDSSARGWGLPLLVPLLPPQLSTLLPFVSTLLLDSALLG